MAESAATIDAILAAGDLLGGHRTRQKAKTLIPDLMQKLGLTTVDPVLERQLEEYVIDVILGAAWYTRKYKSARTKVFLYIAGNASLVVGIPAAIFLGSQHASSAQISTLAAQFTALLTGIFALQKTLSAWFAQRQQYATWYQCSSDLKQIYYDLLRQHAGASAGPKLAGDLDAGAERARKVLDTERLGFYQRLSLPTMDVLDMLTGSSNTVTQLISGLMPPVPGTRPTQSVAVGTKTIADAETLPGSGGIAGPVQEAVFTTTSALPSFNSNTVLNCANAAISNAADVQAMFAPAGGFFTWYNQTLRSTPAFQHCGRARNDTDIYSKFTNFWNQLKVAFGTDTITFVEFCALMSISIEETAGNMTAAPEEVNGMHHAHPGLAYAFDKIPGLKDSYNHGPNRSALQLFRDHDFITAHDTLPGAQPVLTRPGGIDLAWGEDTWPDGFDATPDARVNGFVMQADFFKFRGRGVIQTTWRSDYKEILRFILSADMTSQPDVLSVRQQWETAAGTRSADAKLEFILTVSRTDEWDRIFLNPLILAEGVHIDSAQKGEYLKLSHDANVLSADQTTKGSLLRMAHKINGGDYPSRVVPMMKTMMEGVADLVSAGTVAGRIPRVVGV
jgi:hypothetical protein